VKALFIPLRREWFNAFLAGTKCEEWRRYGARWNETSCAIGREVILSLGFTRTRLTGRVVTFKQRPATGPAADIYGDGTLCAVIGIDLQ